MLERFTDYKLTHFSKFYILVILLSDKSKNYKLFNEEKLLSIVVRPQETTAKVFILDQSWSYNIIFVAFNGTEIYKLVMCYDTSFLISIVGVTVVDVIYKNTNDTKLFKLISDYLSSI